MDKDYKETLYTDNGGYSFGFWYTGEKGWFMLVCEGEAGYTGILCSKKCWDFMKTKVDDCILSLTKPMVELLVKESDTNRIAFVKVLDNKDFPNFALSFYDGGGVMGVGIEKNGDWCKIRNRVDELVEEYVKE